jgi:RNA polymerase sigma factor (sigma-70 family)
MSWPECFEEWAERAWPVVYSHMYNKLRSSNSEERSQWAAEESTQEAMHKVAKLKRLNFTEYQSFLFWLKTTAWRDAIKLLKKDAGVRRRTDPSDPAWIGAVSAVADSDADRQAVLEAVRECLKELTEDQRRIVTWYFVDGLVHREISNLTGMSIASSWKQSGIALARIRRCMMKRDLF